MENSEEEIYMQQPPYVAYIDPYTVYDNLHEFGIIDFIIF